MIVSERGRGRAVKGGVWEIRGCVSTDPCVGKRALDESRQDALTVAYPYFETAEPVVFDEPGTYVETEHEFVHTRSASWNHGLGETATALLSAGLRIALLEEHRSVPWEALPGRMVRGGAGEHRLADHPERVPLTYTLRATKDA